MTEHDLAAIEVRHKAGVNNTTQDDCFLCGCPTSNAPVWTEHKVCINCEPYMRRSKGLTPTLEESLVWGWRLLGLIDKRKVLRAMREMGRADEADVILARLGQDIQRKDGEHG